MLSHKCHWMICQLHVNELPLRHLIIKLDGPVTPRSGFSGPIGKLDKVNELEVNFNLRPVEGTEEITELPEEIVESLSTDQHKCYLLIKAINSGSFSPE